MAINLNDLATLITEKEGGPRQVDVAQTAQVLSIGLEIIFCVHTDEEINELMTRTRKRVAKRIQAGVLRDQRKKEAEKAARREARLARANR